MVQRSGGQVRFVSENWGESKLAARFGIRRYPVVFIDDVLFARPEDFGWFGAKGRFTPWKLAANHEKFKADLARTIDRVRRGETPQSAAAAPTAAEPDLAQLPQQTWRTLDGRTIAPRDLAGKVVVVEFWATWCPPCRATLQWLSEVQRSAGDRLVVIPIAVESEEPAVRQLAAAMKLPFPVVMGSDAVATSFGDITSVPTMFVFDRGGKTASIEYGAPADLHQRVGKTLARLLGPAPAATAVLAPAAGATPAAALGQGQP